MRKVSDSFLVQNHILLEAQCSQRPPIALRQPFQPAIGEVILLKIEDQQGGPLTSGEPLASPILNHAILHLKYLQIPSSLHQLCTGQVTTLIVRQAKLLQFGPVSMGKPFATAACHIIAAQIQFFQFWPVAAAKPTTSLTIDLSVPQV